jgi:hypothetical protein
MSKRPHRNHSPVYKAKVALAALGSAAKFPADEERDQDQHGWERRLVGQRLRLAALAEH